MCLCLHGRLVLLLPAMRLPQVQGSQLDMLPVKALSPSHLKALHDCMDVHIMPCQQQSVLDMPGKDRLQQSHESHAWASLVGCLFVYCHELAPLLANLGSGPACKIDVQVVCILCLESVGQQSYDAGASIRFVSTQLDFKLQRLVHASNSAFAAIF